MRLLTRSRAGLTLIELVVVLFILVLLATVAVTSTEGLVDQSRYETTKSSMKAWEEAVLGPQGERLPDGSPWIRGFVADIGRLPRRMGTADDGLGLQELLTLPAGVTAFTIQSPMGDAQVQLPAGWRGPYLRLAIDSAAFSDGYGNPYYLLKEDATTAAAADEISFIGSFGADEADGGTGVNADLTSVVYRDATPTPGPWTEAPAKGPRHQGDLPFIVTPTAPFAAGDHIVVRLYGPVDGKVVTLRQYSYTEGPGGTPSVSSTSFTMTFPVTPSPLVIGPRAIRAYRMVGAAEPGEEVVLVDSSGLTPLVSKVSNVNPVALVEGGNPPLTIEIP